MTVGKLVRGALYVHRDAIDALDDADRMKIERAGDLSGNSHWNVARVQGDVVALLDYEDFDKAAFPRLLASTRVDLATGKRTGSDFSHSENPLILHRKEQLMARRDAQTARWSETTQRLVEMGLFRDSGAIGRQKAWTARLAAAGLAVVGDEVVSA